MGLPQAAEDEICIGKIFVAGVAAYRHHAVHSRRYCRQQPVVGVLDDNAVVRRNA